MRQIARDSRKDVEPREVERPKRRALRPAGRRPRDRVDFLDAEFAGREHLERAARAEHAEPVRDESRRVVGTNHAFAEAMIEELRDQRRDAGAGPGCRDHFDEAEVARWIEEVRTYHAIPQ